MLELKPLGDVPEKAYLPTGEVVPIIPTGKDIKFQDKLYKLVFFDHKLGLLDLDDNIINCFQLLDPSDNTFYDWSAQGYVTVTKQIIDPETEEVLFDPDVHTQLPSLFHVMKLSMPSWKSTREIKTKEKPEKEVRVVTRTVTVEKPKTIKIGKYEVPLWMPAFVGGVALTKFLEK